MTVILGPCPCQGCGVLLWWVRGDNGHLGWVQQHVRFGWFQPHRCAARAAA